MDYEKGYVYKLMDQGVHLLKCISAQTKAIPGGMTFVTDCLKSIADFAPAGANQ